MQRSARRRDRDGLRRPRLILPEAEQRTAGVRDTRLGACTLISETIACRWHWCCRFEQRRLRWVAALRAAIGRAKSRSSQVGSAFGKIASVFRAEPQAPDKKPHLLAVQQYAARAALGRPGN